MSDFAKDKNVPTNDCISRQEAIDAIIAEGRTVDSRYLESERILHESDAVEAISMLPSAEPEKGRWKRNDNGTYSCNRCQSWIPEEQHYYARYCIYCGAKMEASE